MRRTLTIKTRQYLTAGFVAARAGGQRRRRVLERGGDRSQPATGARGCQAGARRLRASDGGVTHPHCQRGDRRRRSDGTCRESGDGGRARRRRGGRTTHALQGTAGRRCCRDRAGHPPRVLRHRRRADRRIPRRRGLGPVGRVRAGPRRGRRARPRVRRGGGRRPGRPRAEPERHRARLRRPVAQHDARQHRHARPLASRNATRCRPR